VLARHPQFPPKISYLLFRCTLQDVRITHLEIENNTKEWESKENQFIIDYLLLIIGIEIEALCSQ